MKDKKKGRCSHRAESYLTLMCFRVQHRSWHTPHLRRKGELEGLSGDSSPSFLHPLPSWSHSEDVAQGWGFLYKRLLFHPGWMGYRQCFRKEKHMTYMCGMERSLPGERLTNMNTICQAQVGQFILIWNNLAVNHTSCWWWAFLLLHSKRSYSKVALVATKLVTVKNVSERMQSNNCFACRYVAQRWKNRWQL